MRLPVVPQLLRDVTWPHWRAHPIRTAATVLGIALGIASVVGMSDVSATVLDAFREMADTVGGERAVEITTASGRIPEALIDRLTQVSGTEAAAGVVESVLPLAQPPGDELYVLGVDFLRSPIWRAQLPREGMTIPDESQLLRPGAVLLPGRAFEPVAIGGRRLTPSTTPAGPPS